MNMPASPISLEITVYLANGTTAHFVQKDAGLAAALLDRLNPPKAYTPNVLLIGGTATLDSFPTSAILWIELRSSLLKRYPHNDMIHSVEEISEEEFNKRKTWTLAIGAPAMGRSEMVAYQIVRMSNGKIFYLEIHLARPNQLGLPSGRTTMDRANFTTNLFAGHGFHVEKEDGALMILNPAHITQLTLVPGLPIPPSGSWLAESATPL